MPAAATYAPLVVAPLVVASRFSLSYTAKSSLRCGGSAVQEKLQLSKGLYLIAKKRYTSGMKVLVLYRPNSEHARGIEEFLHEFGRRNPADKIETIDIDTREGINAASLYDVMAYPAVLALADDGSELKRWVGEERPLLDELAYYAK